MNNDSNSLEFGGIKIAELIAAAVAAAMAEQLPKMIAAIQAQQLPEREFWDAKIIGHHLGMSAENFLARYACRPDCPKPIRMGHPLWEPDEIRAWARKHKVDFSGRRRARNG